MIPSRLMTFGLVFAVLLSTESLPAEDSNSTQTSLSAGAIEPSTDPQIYGQGVRDSAWQTAADERKGFHLAPGFEVQLFASEPMIAKPMNMAFDQRNRLWLTQTVEYPYPAKDGSEPRDAVMILEDTNGDGTADKATKFADSVNIPIGILPYGDGCICFSIPNLLYLRDTDGDGICDKREVILGPFDTTRDTHGMINALRDGGDGWIYACHGFNNQSQVAGADGHQVTMHSGNTFRFRPDGSRVEHVTHGQVNPFGMTTDEWGYRFSADCHSKPITQLIFGACYPSFGRPHDGLGFLPPMVDHLHGSTAICGIVSYPSDSVTSPLRGQMLSGNVMTSRINRNEVAYQGATAKGRELPDFMTSDDPWFRPVDLQVGLDSHLYVADFYNKIIGHYEVPLTHPDRDRDSGRIWQIRYVGSDAPKNERTAAGDHRYLSGGLSQQIASMHQQFTEGKFNEAELIAAVNNGSAQVSVAAIRLAREWISTHKDSASNVLEIIRNQLHSGNAHAVRASTEILGQHGTTSDIALILERLAGVPVEDVVLQQTMRIAVRDLLKRADSKSPVWSNTKHKSLASIYLGIDRPEVAPGLLHYLSQNPDTDNRDELLAHAVKLAPESELENCVRVADQLTRNSSEQREALMVQLLDAANDSANPPRALRDWISRHVQQRLTAITAQDQVIGWSVTGGGIWPAETRQRRGGGELTIASSIGRGETFVGQRVSDPFEAPAKIEFWLAGHNGFPEEADHGKNRVQLIRVADSSILKEAFPPRSDIAKHVQWDLSTHHGEKVQLRVIDGDQATAYAWLGVGDFEPIWLQTSKHAQWLQGSLDLITKTTLVETSDQLVDLLKSTSLSDHLRFSIAQTLATLGNHREAATLLKFASGIALPSAITTSMLTPEFISGPADFDPVARAIFQKLTQTEQIEFARTWNANGAAVEPLIRFSELGYLSPAVLAKPEVMQMLEPRLNDSLRSRVATITKDLNADQQLDEKLSQLQQVVRLLNVDTDRGKNLFTQHCANCHQLGGVGKVVGPQLDGAVTRTVERLLEDVVTPNRNVDHAFRTSSLLLDDGRVISGLITNETDQFITLADPTGKPIKISTDLIVQRRDSGQSLMPNNFAELLKPDDFRDLIGFVKASPHSK